jgi:hypothetical protein
MPYGDGFLPVEDCAAQMGVSVERLAELVKRGILRADRDGYVQPAILSGAIDEGSSP